MSAIHLSANEASRLGLLEPVEDAFCAQMVKAGFAPTDRDIEFHDERKWRADYVVVVGSRKLLIELDGAIYGVGKPCRSCGHRRGGAHSTAKDILKDIEKGNEAQRYGYYFIRIPTLWVRDSRGQMLTRGIEYLKLFIETITEKKTEK